MLSDLGPMALLQKYPFPRKNKTKQNLAPEDFPDGPVVKTYYNAEGAGSMPSQGAQIPQASWLKKNKTLNRTNVVTNSIKSLKK